MYKPLASPMRATSPAHLILSDFITRTIILYFLNITVEGDLFLYYKYLAIDFISCWHKCVWVFLWCPLLCEFNVEYVDKYYKLLHGRCHDPRVSCMGVSKRTR